MDSIDIFKKSWGKYIQQTYICTHLKNNKFLHWSILPPLLCGVIFLFFAMSDIGSDDEEEPEGYQSAGSDEKEFQTTYTSSDDDDDENDRKRHKTSPMERKKRGIRTYETFFDAAYLSDEETLRYLTSVIFKADDGVEEIFLRVPDEDTTQPVVENIDIKSVEKWVIQMAGTPEAENSAPVTAQNGTRRNSNQERVARLAYNNIVWDVICNGYCMSGEVTNRPFNEKVVWVMSSVLIHALLLEDEEQWILENVFYPKDCALSCRDGIREALIYLTQAGILSRNKQISGVTTIKYALGYVSFAQQMLWVDEVVKHSGKRRDNTGTSFMCPNCNNEIKLKEVLFKATGATPNDGKSLGVTLHTKMQRAFLAMFGLGEIESIKLGLDFFRYAPDFPHGKDEISAQGLVDIWKAHYSAWSGRMINTFDPSRFPMEQIALRCPGNFDDIWRLRIVEMQLDCPHKDCARPCGEFEWRRDDKKRENVFCVLHDRFVPDEEIHERLFDIVRVLQVTAQRSFQEPMAIFDAFIHDRKLTRALRSEDDAMRAAATNNPLLPRYVDVMKEFARQQQKSSIVECITRCDTGDETLVKCVIVAGGLRKEPEQDEAVTENPAAFFCCVEHKTEITHLSMVKKLFLLSVKDIVKGTQAAEALAAALKVEFEKIESDEKNRITELAMKPALTKLCASIRDIAGNPDLDMQFGRCGKASSPYQKWKKQDSSDLLGRIEVFARNFIHPMNESHRPYALETKIKRW